MHKWPHKTPSPEVVLGARLDALFRWHRLDSSASPYLAVKTMQLALLQDEFGWME